MQRAIKGPAAAEMFAVCNALFIAVRRGLVQERDHVLIQTDCMAAIHAYDGTRRVTNPDEVEAVNYFHQFRKEQSFTVSFRHVKGHTRRTEARYVTNNLCDKRAKDGMRQARKKLKEKTQ